MSLSRCGVAYTLALIVDRYGRSEALGELVATALCCLDWMISFLLDCHSEPSEARKLWPWHDEMAGPLHSACLGPCVPSPSLATTRSLMVYHCQAMVMDTAALSTECGIGRQMSVRWVVRGATWSSAPSSFSKSVTQCHNTYLLAMSIICW
jgi:hypothetical protein